ncbi:MAG: hypothetical protein KAS32_00935, partial [Candidatus Peribacteraceae bacterium]|nr:hypothetical protein [Candidatus Peribacteraceae bacterium]
MRKLIILLMIIIAVPCYSQIGAYRDKTAAQLSAMTDYQTVANTAYWNAQAYAQIAALVARADTVLYASDFSDLNTAAAAIPSTGGVLYLPIGTYTVTDTFTIPSNTMIYGSGEATTIKISTKNKRILSIHGSAAVPKTGIIIQNLRFLSENIGTTSNAMDHIHLSYVNDFTITGVISDSAKAIGIDTINCKRGAIINSRIKKYARF